MFRQITRGGVVTLIIVAVLAAHTPYRAVGQTSEQPYIIVEDFNSSADFVSTSSNVFISNGQANWNISRSGGPQFVYRSIPAFSGDVTLIVRGQVDSWSNNCGVKAGVGDGPGSGVSVNFGFTGGGCATNGALISGSGANLDYYESSCQFSGNWLWIEPHRSYSAIFTLSMGIAQLAVSGVGASVGTPTYTGPFNTLYVGQNGDGDWPSCAGTIDTIIVIGGQVDGLTNVSIDPLNAEQMVSDLLRTDSNTILRGIAANLDSFEMPLDLAIAMSLGFYLGGFAYTDAVNAGIESYMPNCLPQDRGTGSADQAAACAELWRQAGSTAYSQADIAIQEWFNVAALQGNSETFTGFAGEMASEVMGIWGELAAAGGMVGTAAAAVTLGHLLTIYGVITGMMHLANVAQAGTAALVAVTNVWITEIGYTAAMDYYNRMR